MGVSGLTTYIDNNNFLLTDYKLKDSTLVIDGNNFYHFIYYLYQVSHVYGGDYKQFSKICFKFFESLSSCKVTPIVVFDGAYDLTNVKFKSAVTRAGKKLIAANSVAHGEFDRVLPLLTHEVFINVLNDLNIKHVTSNFEADNHTASLAAFLNCPVLTNDSDFFVCDLPGGVILLDYLNVALRKDLDGSFYMKTQIFKVQKLVDHMKLTNASFVSLFATILGNEIVDRSIFENFLTKITSKKFANKKLGRHYGKITGLFNWLSDKKTLEGAINDIINECHSGIKEKVCGLIHASISFYSITPSYLQDIISNYEHFKKKNIDLKEKMVNKYGEECPKWLQGNLTRGVVSPRVLNLWVSQKIILQPMVQLSSHKSSHLASRTIRIFIHVLLRSGNQSTFREYLNTAGKLNKEIVNSDLKLETFKKYPDLKSLPKLTKEESLSLYLKLFVNNHSFFLLYESTYCLIVSAILYWSLVTTPTKTTLMALLLSLFAPEVMIFMVPFKLEEGQSVETMVCDHLMNSKYRKRYFDIDFIHSLNEFQSIFQSLSDLNNLLSQPLLPTKILFDSSSSCFIHYYIENNVATFLRYVDRLCSSLPKCTSDFIFDVFNKLETFAKESSGNNKKRTLKKQKKKKPKTVFVPDESEEEEKDEGQSPDVYNDIENKFFSLKLLND